MPLLLSEGDVRARPHDGRSDRRDGGRARRSSRPVGRNNHSGRSWKSGRSHGLVGIMPAYVGDPQTLGAKLVTVYQPTRRRDCQRIWRPSSCSSRDRRTPGDSRRPLHHRGADGGGVGGVGAAPGAPGCAGARDHRLAASRHRATSKPLSGSGTSHEIRVWSPTRRSRRETDRRHAAALDGPDAVAARSVADAARNADVVCARRPRASEPVLRREDVADGAHLCAVGSCRPISVRWIRRSSERPRVRRFAEGALAEAGDLVIPMREGAIDPSHIAGELGEVFGGRVPGRRSRTEITLFKSLGMAVEDVAAARLAYERAVARGLGRGFVL